MILLAATTATAGGPADLARPHDGRSMRAISSHRIGPDGKYDPAGELDTNSNRDNQSVPPGETKVLLEAQGPGVITHMWITFLGPEPHPWTKNGSANHQEMLLRIFYDDDDRPAVEAPPQPSPPPTRTHTPHPRRQGIQTFTEQDTRSRRGGKTRG